MNSTRVREGWLRRWMVLVAMTPVASACTSSGEHGSPSAVNLSTALAATRTPAQPGASADCTSAEVQALVDAFVHAFNVGDQRTLQHLWARRGQGFQWYSTDAPGQRFDPVARDRAGLAGYFVRRHTDGETLRLTSFRFNGNTDGYGNFQYTLIRAAADLPPTAYIGKGAAICGRMPRTLGVWSMAKDLHNGGTP